MSAPHILQIQLNKRTNLPVPAPQGATCCECDRMAIEYAHAKEEYESYFKSPWGFFRKIGIGLRILKYKYRPVEPMLPSLDAPKQNPVSTRGAPGEELNTCTAHAFAYFDHLFAKHRQVARETEDMAICLPDDLNVNPFPDWFQKIVRENIKQSRYDDVNERYIGLYMNRESADDAGRDLSVILNGIEKGADDAARWLKTVHVSLRTLEASTSALAAEGITD